MVTSLGSLAGDNQNHSKFTIKAHTVVPIVPTCGVRVFSPHGSVTWRAERAVHIPKKHH